MPARARAWVEASVGRRAHVLRARQLRGGTASAVHAVDVGTPSGRVLRLVLRRNVRLTWLMEEPDLAEKEARNLQLLERSAIPAPRLVAVDPNGADCDVPAVLMTRMPGFVTPAAPKPVVEELAAIVAEFNPDGMRVMIQALAQADLRDELRNVAVPSLLLWGDQDVRSPLGVAADLHARIPGSRLVVIEQAGHLSHVEAPERFNSELRSFLDSVQRVAR